MDFRGLALRLCVFAVQILSTEVFDAEDDGGGVDAIEGFDFLEGGGEFPEGAGVEEEDHVDEGGVWVGGIDGGVGAGDADLVFCEDVGDGGDDADFVGDVEADVVGGGGVFDGDEGACLAVGEEAAVAGAGGDDPGGLDEVCDDGGCGGALAGSGSVEEGFSGGVCVDGDGVEDSVDGGEDVFFGDEGGLDAELDCAAIALADDGEELDDVAEGFGEIDVGGADLLDAGDVDVFGVDGEAVGEGGEEDGFVGGVPAVDV